MIVGVGTDLCDIGRIERSLGRFGERFAQRILVAYELDRFHGQRKPAAYLAKRFAAKEAFSKALGTGIHFPVNWHNVWVENARSGKPSLRGVLFGSAFPEKNTSLLFFSREKSAGK